MQEAVEALAALLVAWGEPAAWAAVAWAAARTGSAGPSRRDPTAGAGPYPCGMSPFWIWTQVAIVVAVVASFVIAIVKLA